MKLGRFNWSEEATTTFHKIEQKLISAPVLILPDFSKTFELHCDASKVTTTKKQKDDGKSPSSFYCEKLNSSKVNYSTYDVQFYAIVQAFKHWSSYLAHNEFILFIDLEVLKHINSQDKLSTRHVKWASYLQQFTFVLKHQSGT
ncbi:unnamed protein product, partial [Prunus brigantina]